MPHLSGPITPWGPLINISVGVSGPRAVALAQAGQAIPQRIIAKLVVDTGASGTALDCTILQQLGLTPTGNIEIHTPSTPGIPHSALQYDISILIFGANAMMPIFGLHALPVIDGQFKPQGVDGLLGRDVLGGARLTYFGSDNWYGISF